MPEDDRAVLHTGKGLFGNFCGTPELDRLIEKAQLETDPAVRHSLYSEIEQIISDRALLVPLFHEQAYRFAGAEVEGFDVTFYNPIVAYEKLSIRR